MLCSEKNRCHVTHLLPHNEHLSTTVSFSCSYKMAIAERFDFTGILMHVLFSFVIDDSGGSVWQDWLF